MSFLLRSARRSTLCAVAVLLVAMVSAANANADSVRYGVTGTFSSGLTLSGHYDWDNDSNIATGYLFNLTDTAGPASCADPGGSCTFFSEADFVGTGPLDGTFEAVLSILDPNTPQFIMAILDDQGNLLYESDVITLNAQVVPEPSTISTVLLALIMLAITAGIPRTTLSRRFGNF